jgi:hypothetical protein
MNALPRPSGQALVSDQAAARLDPSGFDPSRYAVQVQHSSDKLRDGTWHTLEDTDLLSYAVERGYVFAVNYAPRPIRICDLETDTDLTLDEARRLVVGSPA